MTLNFREEDEKKSTQTSIEAVSERSIIDQHLAIEDEKESKDSELFDEDDDDDDESEPTKAITKHNFASSPWSMMSAVGGAFFVVFGGGYLFLNSVFNGGSASVAEEKEIKVEENAKATEENDGDVYAKLALKQQQDELAKLNSFQEMDDEEVTEEIEKAKKEGKDKTDTKQNIAAKPKPRPRPAPRRVVKSTPRRPAPRPAPRRRATPVAQRRTSPAPKRSSIPKAQPTPIKRATPPSSGVSKVAKNISREPQVAKDPLAELNRLRNIGSFGKINYAQASNKNNSQTKETLVANRSPIYETPRERRLRRRKMQIENVANTQSTNTSTDSSVRTIRANNAVKRIKPKWEPVFETEEVKFTPNVPENQPSPIALYSSPNIPIATNYPPQSIKEKPDFIEKIKQAKIHQNNNNYYASQTSYLAQNNSSNLVEAIKRAKPQEKQIEDSHSFQTASNQQYLAQEERFFEVSKPKYLMVGEYANGRLLTPISQRQTEEQLNDNKRFVAKLTQDIRDNTGAIAIPRGTLLAVRIISVDGASAASVEVTAIIKNETEYPLPPGTISVYGKNGTPLIAKQFKDKGGEIARYDTTVAVMGGLAKVGEIINQPEDEETIEDPFTGRIRNTRRNSRRSIGGAVLEGAFGELTDVVKKRAETSTQEIISRPNTWFIPAKTKLTFIVNHSIQLPSRL